MAATPSEKRCSRCKDVKPLSAFSKRTKVSGDVPASRCKPCATLAAQAWSDANPERRRTARLLRDYGVEPGTYEKMLASQKGVCAICFGDNGGRALVLDHDHSTMKARGLLCGFCNVGLGVFRDNRAALMRAAEYLAGAR